MGVQACNRPSTVATSAPSCIISSAWKSSYQPPRAPIMAPRWISMVTIPCLHELSTSRPLDGTVLGHHSLLRWEMSLGCLISTRARHFLVVRSWLWFDHTHENPPLLLARQLPLMCGLGCCVTRLWRMKRCFLCYCIS